jgi:branched-chain amino acid transport system ATP-binding protein
MLKVANLNVSIGAVAIIRDVSLELGAGEMCGLIGRNGAGKTTLLRTPPHCRVAHGIGYMPEDRRLVPEFTVEQNIRLPSWAVKLSGVDERLDWIFTIIPEVARVRDRRALELSGGQQKLVALARALMAGRRMLLLDEPFEGLAPAIARRLGEVLASLNAQAVTVLLSESNEVHVADLLARAYRIERGAVTRA